MAATSEPSTVSVVAKANQIEPPLKIALRTLASPAMTGRPSFCGTGGTPYTYSSTGTDVHVSSESPVGSVTVHSVTIVSFVLSSRVLTRYWTPGAPHVWHGNTVDARADESCAESFGLRRFTNSV